MANNPDKNNTVIIIGGGFAGLTTALSLAKYQHHPPIVLIEPQQNFVFLPLLFELVSGEIKYWQIAHPYIHMLSKRGISLIKERVVSIDCDSQKVNTSSGQTLKYAQLVISTGLGSESLDIPGLQEHSLMFQSLIDVKRIREHIKRIKLSDNPKKNFLVIGGGSTGVELCCKLADLLKGTISLHLIELEKQLLSKSRAFNREQAQKALKAKGVHVYLQTKVIEITKDVVKLESYSNDTVVNSSIQHQGIVWTAGRKVVVPALNPPIILKNHRLPINSHLEVKGLRNVLAIGDIAFNEEKTWPSNAQVAVQQGIAASKVLIALQKNQIPNSFEFEDRGEMLSLGCGQATITAFGITFSGPIAFQIRKIIYITKFPDFSTGLRTASAWLMGL